MQKTAADSGSVLQLQENTILKHPLDYQLLVEIVSSFESENSCASWQAIFPRWQVENWGCLHLTASQHINQRWDSLLLQSLPASFFLAVCTGIIQVLTWAQHAFLRWHTRASHLLAGVSFTWNEVFYPALWCCLAISIFSPFLICWEEPSRPLVPCMCWDTFTPPIILFYTTIHGNSSSLLLAIQ